MRRWLARIGLVLGAGLLLAVGLVAWLARASLPQLTGELDLPGLSGPVTVSRDAHGIPLIEAGSAADAHLALGFVHGQDRLWQMEFDRLAGQGRLAEILGEAALPSDRLLRTLGIAAQAEHDATGLDPETARLLAAYAAGVNAAIAAFGALLPPEFLLLRHRPEPWRPADSLRLAKLMALDLSTNWREELLRARLMRQLPPDQIADLWPDTPDPGPVTMAALARLPLEALAQALPPEPPPGIGSNVWVAAGSRTGSGHPLLANDPHLSLQMPGHWYLAHLRAPGLAASGATLPGLPFIVLGRNPDLAWGFTNTGSDTQDLFVERLDPADPERYLTPSGSAPFRSREETIRVRGADPVRLRVRETRHGPVVSDLAPATAATVLEPGQVLALAWTQLRRDRPDTTMAAGFALGRATDVASFVAAALLYQGAQQNMAVADRHGTIGMVSPGLVPIRRSGDGRMPVPGWSGQHDWLGTIPPDELPRQIDPADGVLVNANNQLVADGYPHLLTADWEPPYRAERILALLGTPGRYDAERFAAIQLDRTSRLAADFLPFLPPAAAVPAAKQAALARLAAWDGIADLDRPEPLLFAAWYRELAVAIAGDELGPALGELRRGRAAFLRRVLTRSPGWCDNRTTPPVETCADAAAAAFVAAAAVLEQRYGAGWAEQPWARAHPAVLAHRPFERVPVLRRWFSRLVPFGGDGTTVNVAHAGVTRDDLPFGTVHAAGYRGIYDLAHADGGRWITATGQSGHPLSPLYGDQAGLWGAGAYLPLRPGDAPARVLRLRPPPA